MGGHRLPTAALSRFQCDWVKGEGVCRFGAEFTQVYAVHAGRAFVPDKYAVRV
jgi:hypothetical protein